VFTSADVEAGTLLLVSEPLATCPIAPPPGSKAARSTIRPISLVEQLLSKMFNPGQLKWLQVGFLTGTFCSSQGVAFGLQATQTSRCCWFALECCWVCTSRCCWVALESQLCAAAAPDMAAPPPLPAP
jgi:hypothetical protein